MTVNKFNTIFIKLFMVLVLIDFSGDYLLRSDAGIINLLQNIVRMGMIVTLSITALLGLFTLPTLAKCKMTGLISLGFIFLIFAYGLSYGILANDAVVAAREFIAVLPLLFIPLLLRLEREQVIRIGVFFVYAITLIFAVKLVLSQVASIYADGSLSWKVFLKSSALLILPYMYFLIGSIQKKSNLWKWFFLCIVTIEVFMAQSRVLNVAIFLGTLLIVATNFNRKFVLLAIALGASIFLALIFTGGAFENILGIWSGPHFAYGVSYRQEQLEILVSRYVEHPFIGYGFGYYTSGYETYGDLAFPAQLELDLINFSTKIGIPLFSIYIFTYIAMAIQHKINGNLNLEQKAITLSFVLSLFLLLFYSLFQTMHSGVSFWLLYSLSFVFIFRRNSLQRMTPNA